MRVRQVSLCPAQLPASSSSKSPPDLADTIPLLSHDSYHPSTLFIYPSLQPAHQQELGTSTTYHHSSWCREQQESQHHSIPSPPHYSHIPIFIMSLTRHTSCINTPRSSSHLLFFLVPLLSPSSSFMQHTKGYLKNIMEVLSSILTLI